MRKIIIGKRGIGKTMLIVKEIIPTTERYFILDFCDEYFQWVKDETKIQKFERGLVGNELKQQVINIIRNVKDDTTFIIDNANLLYFPQFDDGGFLWLREELMNKNYVLVFQSILSIIEGGVPDIFDDIYYFSTRDDDDIITSYLAQQMAEGKNVKVMNGFN